MIKNRTIINKTKKILTAFMALAMISQGFTIKIYAKQNNINVAKSTYIGSTDIKESGFEVIKKEYIKDKDSNDTVYYLKHKSSGASVFYLDDGKDEKTFSIGFKTPPSDNKGENHVLEHSLMCSSDKYPSKDLGTYLQNNSVATMINAFTKEDSTSYAFKTYNKTDFYNLEDVYINAVLAPRVLKDENIFKQQGIRKEYAKGQVSYNGVVYNEMRLKSLQSGDNALDFVYNKMITNLYGNSVPSFNSGGNVADIVNLKYWDVLNVYKKYYTPSNSITCISGSQDILKTLNLLNSYLKSYSPGNIKIQWNYSPHKPSSSTETYNITKGTKKVDIGFLYSGPKVTNTREAYTYEALLSVITNRLRKAYKDIYTVGGNGGGISNIAFIISGVDSNKKDKAVEAVNSIINSLKNNGIDKSELNEALSETQDSLENTSSVTETSDLALNVFLYSDDPFLFINSLEEFNNLKNNSSYFKAVLDKYFINNKYKSTVISGPVANSSLSADINISNSELENIKEETNKFNAWAETPDSPEILKKLPVLSLDDFKQDRLAESGKTLKKEKVESINGVNCYATIDDSAKMSYLNMYFDLPQFSDEVEYAALMTRYLNYEFSLKGYDNISCALDPCTKFTDENSIHPKVIISITYGKEPVAEATNKAIEMLNNNKLFLREELQKFIKEEKEDTSSRAAEPYQIAYDLMMSNQNQGDKFNTFTMGNGSNGQGSMFYYKFINQISKEQDYSVECIKKLQKIYNNTINKNGLIIGFGGTTSQYTAFKQAFNSAVNYINKKARPVYNNTIKSGYTSAMILSEKQNVSQIMQSGNIYSTGYKFSGKMKVLSQLINSKYLVPVLRDKMGAYGAGANFTNGTATFSVAGIEDIDEAVKVFKATGNFLKKLSITQKQLDSIIISAVSQFDEEYNSDSYYEEEAINGCSISELKKIRNEMLNTTVDDIKNYAAFIDNIISQNHVFAFANKKTSEKTNFPFAFTVNSADFTIKQDIKK